MAIWSYFKGCKRAEGIDGGATIVAFIKNKGWFWYIPLENNITSVGVVAESSYLMRNGIRGIDNVFSREVQNNKWLSGQLKDVERIADFTSTTDYSLQSKCSAAPGLVLVGDALAFLDPVFSSGVLLALKSGVMVGDVLNQALKDSNIDSSCFDEYHNRMQLSIENMRKLIHAFYNVNISFKDIMQQHPWAINQITDCLSGDLEMDYTELWSILK
jgi:flavin-dependent dehydrogenase